MKWVWAALIAVVGSLASVALLVGLLWVYLTYPEWTIGAIFLAGFIVGIVFLTRQVHAWLLDQAYVRRKRRAHKLDLLAAQEEALAENAARSGTVRAER